MSELRRRETTEAAVRLQGLRAMAIETIHQAIADGNKRMSCWLVERLGLFRAPSLEEMAGDGEAGADQLDSETILDMADTVHDVARATRILDSAEQDVSYATARAEVTSPSDQGDKQVTVTCRNLMICGRGETYGRFASIGTPGCILVVRIVSADFTVATFGAAVSWLVRNFS